MNFSAYLTESHRNIRHVRFLGLALLTAAAFLFSAAEVSAQRDTTETEVKVDRGRVEGEVVETGPTDRAASIHSPKKATIMSAALPGLGQIYNKKWWKVPIIYGGFAAAGYYLKDNLDNIDYYKKAYRAATDDDPTTQNPTNFSEDHLLKIVDQYKQWRDLSYIAIAAIYILNVVDANVDAHLFYFDVSEDISFQVHPYVSPNYARMPGLGGGTAGLTLSLKL